MMMMIIMVIIIIIIIIIIKFSITKVNNKSEDANYRVSKK